MPLRISVTGTDDALEDKDGAQDAQDGPGDAEDDAEGDDSEQEDPQRHGKPQAVAAQRWEIVLAEWNEAGEWHTVGSPIPNVDFMEQALAYDYTERENKRRFGRGFDWADDPGRAWVAVREETRGRS